MEHLRKVRSSVPNEPTSMDESPARAKALLIIDDYKRTNYN